MEDAPELIREHLKRHQLCHGVGDEETMSSIVAINLAINGERTFSIPDCMSLAMGRWIIYIQEAIPIDILNGDGWRNLLPLAAVTGRNHEKEIALVAFDWMWDVVIPQLQGLADCRGFGDEWRAMCSYRTAAAAYEAASSADRAAKAYVDVTAAYGDDDSDAAAAAARAVAYAAARAVAYASPRAYAARAADAARAASAANAANAASADFWRNVDPTKALRKMIEVTQ